MKCIMKDGVVKRVSNTLASAAVDKGIATYHPKKRKSFTNVMKGATIIGQRPTYTKTWSN